MEVAQLHKGRPLTCCSRSLLSCYSPRRLTHMDFIHRLPHRLCSGCGQLMGDTSRRLESGRRVRSGHLFTQHLPCWLVSGGVPLPNSMALVRLYILSSFLNLSLFLPFKLRGSDRSPLLLKRGFHHSLLVSFNSAHSFLNSPFLKLFLVTPI